jgi:hypothetical protein
MNVRAAYVLIAQLALAGALGAQEPGDDGATGAPPPLGSVDASMLEPAVDVGALQAPSQNPAQTPIADSQPVTAPPLARTAPSAGRAMDTLDLGTTSITGNQELPKVLYIVPWKRSDLGDLIGRPVNSLLDEVLAPVDPEVFERNLSYYETLHGESIEE